MADLARRGSCSPPAWTAGTTCVSTSPSCARKLEPVPSHPRYLITETGIGYRFAPEESP